MSPESRTIKRGDPFPGPRDEAILVGPYPTWDKWKGDVQFLEKFPDVLKNGTEELFRKFYISRRLIQKSDGRRGVIMTDWTDLIDDPDFIEKNKEALIFIRGRTETPLEKGRVRVKS